MPHRLRFLAVFALALGAFSADAALRPATAQVAPQKLEVRGLLRDAAGAPIAGADVVLTSNFLVNGKPPAPQKWQSDGAGRFAGQIEAPQPDENEPQNLDAAALLKAWRVSVLVHANGFALSRVDLRAGDNEITLVRGVAASVTVRDAAGKAVGGARVRAKYIRLADNGDELSRFLSFVNVDDFSADSPLKGALTTLTAPDGSWTLRDLPPGGSAYVTLDDPRFIGKSVEAALSATPDEPASAAPDLVAKPGARVVGRVLFPDGKPVADAAITALVTADEQGYAQTRTAPDGTFSLWGLPAGKATIQIAPPDEKWAPAGVEGVALSISAETRAPDITLSAGLTLTGIITDAATKMPLKGARVMAGGPFGYVQSTPSDAQGRYTVRAIAGQTRFYVYSYPRDYLRDRGENTTRTLAPDSKAAPDFALRRGVTLFGTALDENGQPATGATIASGSLFEGAMTVVDDKGAWTLHGANPRELRPGDDPNRPSGNVFLKTSGDWQIVSGARATASTSPIALKLRRIQRQDVTARVVTPDGAPVAGAKVNIGILFDATNGSRRFETGVTNARGEFALRNLRPDESAEITPSKTGYNLVKKGAIAVLDAKKNAPRAADAVLTPLKAFVTGRVVDAQNARVAGALVAPLSSGNLREAGLGKTDAQGRFRLENLSAGEMSVGAAQGRSFGQAKVAAGGQTEIKLQSAAP